MDQITPNLPIRGPLKGCTYLVYCRCADHGGVPHWHYCARTATRLDPALLVERCYQHESKPQPSCASGSSEKP